MDPVIFQMQRYSETLDKTSFTWLARLLIQYALHPLQIIHSRFEMKKNNNKTKQNKIKQNKTKQNKNNNSHKKIKERQKRKRKEKKSLTIFDGFTLELSRIVSIYLHWNLFWVWRLVWRGKM